MRSKSLLDFDVRVEDFPANLPPSVSPEHDQKVGETMSCPDVELDFGRCSWAQNINPGNVMLDFRSRAETGC
jgi:hypothetical protein